MQLAEDHFVRRFNSRSALDVQSENSVRTRRLRIQIVLSYCLIHLPFEQTVQGFLFWVTDLLGEAFDGYSTALIICNLQVLIGRDLTRFGVWQQIPDLLVIDLCVTAPYCNRLVELIWCESVKLWNGSWHYATVLVNCIATCHWVRFTSAGLTIAKNGAIVTFDDRVDDPWGCFLIDLVLAGIVKNLFKCKFPHVCLIVDHTECFILVLFEGDGTLRKVNFDVFACEVGGGPGSNHHFHGLLVRHIYDWFIAILY